MPSANVALVRRAHEALNNGDPDSAEVWAPVHAWRALGQLRAEASIAPLLVHLKTADPDDVADLELPVVFGMIGPAAVPDIADFISDRVSRQSLFKKKF